MSYELPGDSSSETILLPPTIIKKKKNQTMDPALQFYLAFFRLEFLINSI